MAAPPSPDPAALMDELVEDCLLRLPPEDPADLARAALVSKQWHRVVTGATFRRRYIEFHRRSAPLLGYMLNLDDDPTRFVPTSSFRPPQAAHRDRLRAVHSRHGRVLLHSGRPGYGIRLLVWDPRKDKQWELPVLQADAWIEDSAWNAALVCAGGDGCSHLDCHFKVVVVIRYSEWLVTCFYFSSEALSWSDAIFVSEEAGFSSSYCSKPHTVFVGNAFYFKTGDVIFKLDLQTHRMRWTWISRGLPTSSPDLQTHRMFWTWISRGLPTSSPLFATEDDSNLLFATEDGNTVGLAKIINNSTLCVWLQKQGTWVESRCIRLRGLLPDDALCDPLLPPQTYIDKPSLVGFSETGAGVIFLRTCVGYFTIDLNSGRSMKVGDVVLGWGHIVPYVSFCTPAPGKVSTDLGPAASVVVSTDDEPGAGVVVSRDERLGDVAVSTDERPGDVHKKLKSQVLGHLNQEGNY